MSLIIENIHRNGINFHFLLYNNNSLEKFTNLISELELNKVEKFRSQKRKNEFIAIRILMNIFYPKNSLIYNEIGAPKLHFSDLSTSISHGTNLVCLATSNSPIGIDLEIISDQANRLKKKFLTEKEMNLINDSKDYTKFWSVKESLYKLANRKKIDFKKELVINNSINDEYNCEIINSDSRYKVEICTFEYKDHVVTYNKSNIV